MILEVVVGIFRALVEIYRSATILILEKVSNKIGSKPIHVDFKFAKVDTG
jgi:hypothetical protein